MSSRSPRQCVCAAAAASAMAQVHAMWSASATVDARGRATAQSAAFAARVRALEFGRTASDAVLRSCRTPLRGLAS